MSVTFRVRSISDELRERLEARPEIATRLAQDREAVDFERTTFLARYANAKASEWAMKRAEALEKEHAATWSELVAAGVQRRDVDAALEVGAAGVGLGWAFVDTGITLFEETAGLRVGDDVGYGPTRLFTPSETKSFYDAMLALPIATFASHYERADKGDVPDAYVTFEAVVAARVALASYLQTAKVSWRALLVWAD